MDLEPARRRYISQGTWPENVAYPRAALDVLMDR